MTLTPDDAIIIQGAVQRGVFWGSFYGAIVFHLFLFGGIILLGSYANKKYGEKIKNILSMFGMKS